MTLETPLWIQGGSFPARLDRQLIANIFTEGILGPTSFAVTERAAGANFTVDVAAGVAVVTGDDQANQGRYVCISTAVESVTIPAAPGSNSRYDLIIVDVNDPTAGGGAGDNFTVRVVEGAAAASPAVPATPDSALLLAVIGPIATATVSITNSLIADSRVASRLAHDVVAAANIADGTVGTAELADGSVTTAKLVDLNVTTGKLAASAVTTAKITDINVTTAKIADLNVTTGKLADLGVTTAKIADNAVTSGKSGAAESSSVTGVTLKRYGQIVLAWGDAGVGGQTIPANWRPVATVRVPSNVDNSGTSGFVIVNTSGLVQVMSAVSNNYFSASWTTA